MKQLLFLFLFFSITGFSQDFTLVDATVKSYPMYTSPERLATKIIQDFNDDASKVRAAFKWLTNNIQYNLEEYHHPKIVHQIEYSTYQYSSEKERLRKASAMKERIQKRANDKIVRDAFLTRKGVCEEYVQSFKKLADLLGIESEIIRGNVRNSINQIGKVPLGTNHAWNALKINGRWAIIDVTWASGYSLNNKWIQSFNDYYFDMDSRKIGFTHYPSEERWQKILNSGAIVDFYNQPIFIETLLEKNIELLTPKKGVVTVKKKQKLTFKFKNLLPNHKLSFKYKGQSKNTVPTITYHQNIATFSINSPKKDSELYFFLDNWLAMEYKIQVN